MPSTNGTDVVFLSKSVTEVVDNFGLEERILGIKSDSGENIWVCNRAVKRFPGGVVGNGALVSEGVWFV